jgi:hypothetical protein
LARYHAMQLMTSEEEYFLQIDSHMRFVDKWDEILLSFYAKACAGGVTNALLTAYPAGYELPNKLPPAAENWTALVADSFNEVDGMLRARGRAVSPSTAGRVHRCSLVAAGLLFCTAAFARSALVYDCDLPQLFFGEELLLAVRAYRAGAQTFWPGAHVAFHLWSRAHRPTFRQLPATVEIPFEKVVACVRGFLDLYCAFAVVFATASVQSTRNAFCNVGSIRYSAVEEAIGRHNDGRCRSDQSTRADKAASQCSCHTAA